MANASVAATHGVQLVRGLGPYWRADSIDPSQHAALPEEPVRSGPLDCPRTAEECRDLED